MRFASLTYREGCLSLMLMYEQLSAVSTSPLQRSRLGFARWPRSISRRDSAGRTCLTSRLLRRQEQGGLSGLAAGAAALGQQQARRSQSHFRIHRGVMVGSALSERLRDAMRAAEFVVFTDATQTAEEAAAMAGVKVEDVKVLQGYNDEQAPAPLVVRQIYGVGALGYGASQADQRLKVFSRI